MTGGARIWRGLRRICALALILIVLPAMTAGGYFYAKGWPQSWNAADWSSARIAPDPAAEREAIVQVYAARAGRWKGVLAVHTWIAFKPRDARRFIRHDVVGWGRPVRRDNYPVDGRWYSNEPEVVFELRGARAQKLIPEIVAAIARYPFSARGSYEVWPGPNSNTFIAWIGRQVPERGLEIPPTAVGKDYMGDGFIVASTPSGSGWQVSWGGVLGAAVGLKEGVEIHVLGATIGIDPQDLAIKLPGLGLLGPKSFGAE
ncbi:MAG: DUF3750 domain-containing protein [Hyphomicrobiales bacterium]